MFFGIMIGGIYISNSRQYIVDLDPRIISRISFNSILRDAKCTMLWL